MDIFVGNLNYASTEDAVRELFEEYGEVASVKIISNRETGRSRGFGFIEMPNESEGKAAVEALDGKELDGRQIRVSEARAKPDRDEGRGDRSEFGGGSSEQDR